MTDVFAVQDEISQGISEALKVRLAPRAQPVNIEAWQHCLRARHHYFRYTPESLAKAKECYEQALSIDPNFAMAWSGLAGRYYALAILGMKPAAEVAPLSKSAVEKALALDPANSEAHSVRATLTGLLEFDWEAAATHLRAGPWRLSPSRQ